MHCLCGVTNATLETFYRPQNTIITLKPVTNHVKNIPDAIIVPRRLLTDRKHDTSPDSNDEYNDVKIENNIALTIN